MSLIQVLKESGMNEAERDSIMELVMEVSGARGLIDDALTIVDNFEVLGIGEHINEVRSSSSINPAVGL